MDENITNNICRLFQGVIKKKVGVVGTEFQLGGGEGITSNPNLS